MDSKTFREPAAPRGSGGISGAAEEGGRAFATRSGGAGVGTDDHPVRRLTDTPPESGGEFIKKQPLAAARRKFVIRLSGPARTGSEYPRLPERWGKIGPSRSPSRASTSMWFVMGNDAANPELNCPAKNNLSKIVIAYIHY
jgi:hypothetical protein